MWKNKKLEGLVLYIFCVSTPLEKQTIIFMLMYRTACFLDWSLEFQDDYDIWNKIKASGKTHLYVAKEKILGYI